MSSGPAVVYVYSRCSTCRKAVAWLQERQIPFVEKPIADTPPSPAELTRMLALQEGNLRRLFNTSGLEYRGQGLAAKLPTLAAAEAIALLAGNGRLVKRPFVLGPDFGLVGFDAQKWAEVRWPR